MKVGSPSSKVPDIEPKVESTSAYSCSIPRGRKVDVKIEEKDLRIDVLEGGPGGQSGKQLTSWEITIYQQV